MAIFALGDPHFSFSTSGQEYKPMGIFGDNWLNHSQKIKANWESVVSPEDVVLVPGDISWALKLEEARQDLEFLGQLPGLKLLVKGNHDLWWQSVSKVRKSLPPSIKVIQNDHYLLENGIAICGTRGWTCPNDKGFDTDHDQKVYEREVNRLRLSLETVKQEVEEIIVMLHYPPTNGKHEPSGFTELLQKFNVKTCVYAHLHSESIQGAIPREKWGINFYLVSADAIGFTPLLVR
ncbi:MAG: phosphohydrolase [Clostridia bacterium]|nr:phosphohydrolase [Clostridia bacterium]